MLHKVIKLNCLLNHLLLRIIVYCCLLFNHVIILLAVFANSRDLFFVSFLYIRQIILDRFLFFSLNLRGTLAWYFEVELLWLVTHQLAAFHLNIRRWCDVLLWDNGIDLIQAKQRLIKILLLLALLSKLKKIIAQLLTQLLDLSGFSGGYWLKQHRFIILGSFLRTNWLLKIESRARRPY